MPKKRANGEGSAPRQRADGRWVAKVTVGFDPKTGKQKFKDLYGKTRAEASRKQREFLAALDNGQCINPSKMTIAQWLAEWLDVYKRPTCKPNTIADYENSIKNHLVPRLGRMKLVDLRADHVQRAYNDIANDFSPNAVRLCHAVLHQALDRAVKNDMILRNPSDATERPKVVKKDIEVFSLDEQRAFLQAIKGERLEGAFILMLSTGMRRGETLGLKWSDIDFEEKILRINRTLIRIGTGRDERGEHTELTYGTPKTAKSRRTIPLHDITIAALQAHQRRQKEEMLAAGRGYQRDDLVFCTHFGGPLELGTIGTVMNRILERASLPHYTVHALRHTFATRMLEQGEDMKVVSEILGHATIQLTYDTYVHVLKDKKTKAMQSIGWSFGN